MAEEVGRKIRVHIGCWDYGLRSSSNVDAFKLILRRMGLAKRFEFTNGHTRGLNEPQNGDHNKADYLIGLDSDCAEALNRGRFKPLTQSKVFSLASLMPEVAEKERLDRMKQRIQARRIGIIKTILKAEGIEPKSG